VEEAATLEALEEAIWAALTDGSKNNHSGFRFLHLASVNAANEAETRTVVLREVYSSKQIIQIHTDARSEKIKQIQHNPIVSVSVYDKETRVQLRLKGRCEIFHNDELTTSILQNISPEAKRTYGLTIHETLKNQKNQQLHAEYHPESVRNNFVVLQLSIEKINFLHLGEAYHTAAVFEYHEGKLMSKAWQTP
jgi:pyridoxamine 5'-phosphate oxidase